jgi:flagellar hook-associated protein 3 FlgL
VGPGSLTVAKHEGSEVAELLGLVPEGSTSASSASGTLAGADRHFLETTSVFTTLIRLRDALNTNDTAAVERAINDIDDDIDRTSFAHAEIGAREQALDVSTRALEDEDVQLRSALSSEIDIDLVEAISNLTARQTSLQASLQAMANMLQLSLLNYL